MGLGECRRSKGGGLGEGVRRRTDTVKGMHNACRSVTGLDPSGCVSSCSLTFITGNLKGCL